MGHEAVGEVLEVGRQVRTLVSGQRVVLIPGASCRAMEMIPPCAMCHQGLPLLCLRRDEVIPQLACGGGWSEQFVRHESQLIPVPDDLTDEQAVLIEPLACSVHTVLRRLPRIGETVIVIGCGSIGLGIILALRALAIPLRIIAISKHAYQAQRARAMGADLVLQNRNGDLYEQLASELGTEVSARGADNRLLHHGASVVYDAVGTGETLQHALRWTRARGTVVLEGIAPQPATFDRTVLWLREVDLLGAHGYGLEHYDGRRMHTFHLVIEWLRHHRIVPDGFITHRYPLKKYKSALRAADDKSRSSATKVLLQMKPDA